MIQDVETVYMSVDSPDRFREAMIDLAANAGAILAIAAALYLLARRPLDSEKPD